MMYKFNLYFSFVPLASLLNASSSFSVRNIPRLEADKLQRVPPPAMALPVLAFDIRPDPRALAFGAAFR
jgi:hypothetical protein